VDGVGYDGYVKDADINIEDLHRRLHSGKYKALPSLRCYIPKQNGGMRPPGIAAIEDQVVQCAVVEVLSSIYEVDFFGNSYGFRPEIGWHNALDKLYMDIPTRKVNWIVVADIRSLFDSISHDWLVRFLEHRIGDPRILRLIKLWLKAGFVKDGKWANTEVGSAGGSSASPQLANIFLHYVLDLWVAKFAREADEEVHFARYVDDFVTCFQSGDEAVKFLESLKLRLAKFGL
jgi:group II intron reverse transcriptase/maturase